MRRRVRKEILRKQLLLRPSQVCIFGSEARRQLRVDSKRVPLLQCKDMLSSRNGDTEKIKTRDAQQRSPFGSSFSPHELVAHVDQTQHQHVHLH
jgi:hypothetical protein